MPRQEPIEEAPERMVRSALAELEPARIDIDAAWRTVAPRLMNHAAGASTSSRRRLVDAPFGLAGRPRRALAAALAIAVLLSSAGFVVGFAYSQGCFRGGSPFVCSDIPQLGDGDFFQEVNQSQELHGVTVTITSVYADRGVTLIGYAATMTPDLAARYDEASPGAMTVTADSGEQAIYPPPGGHGILCDAPERTPGRTVCYAQYGPLHPGAAATSVPVTVEIPLVGLHRGLTDNGLAGPWRFHFTMTFHQQDRHIITLPPAPGPNQQVPASTPAR